MPLKLSYKSTVLFNLADELSPKYQEVLRGILLYFVLNTKILILFK